MMPFTATVTTGSDGIFFNQKSHRPQVCRFLPEQDPPRLTKVYPLLSNRNLDGDFPHARLSAHSAVGSFHSQHGGKRHEEER